MRPTARNVDLFMAFINIPRQVILFILLLITVLDCLEGTSFLAAMKSLTWAGAQKSLSSRDRR